MANELRRQVRSEPRRVWTKFAEPAKDAVEFMHFSKPLSIVEAEAVRKLLEEA